LEDKFFFIVRAANPRGELKKNIEGGKNAWLTEKDLFKLPEVFDGVDETIRIIRAKEFQFVERKYTIKRY